MVCICNLDVVIAKKYIGVIISQDKSILYDVSYPQCNRGLTDTNGHIIDSSNVISGVDNFQGGSIFGQRVDGLCPDLVKPQKEACFAKLRRKIVCIEIFLFRGACLDLRKQNKGEG